MLIDATLLSRIQFGFTISFHILFPAFSIGLIFFIAAMEGMWLKTKNFLYLSITQFWTKIFALTFGMGVVSGLVMEFQLGTNFSGFTRMVGSVLGPLFTYEVMTAFFIEAGFLGIMLFGWKRVSHRLHFGATLLVLLGTILSAYWILAANSWMQHPVGAIWKNGKFIATDWPSIIFNQAAFYRFIHMMLAAYLCAAFAVISVSALYLLRNQFIHFAQKCFRVVWIAVFILAPLQIIFGDLVGLKIFEHQPIKTAAMEGLWTTTQGAPLVLFAVPNQKKEENLLEIKIPYVASLLNTHHFKGTMPGLKSVSKEERPNVMPVFFSFRLMVLIGVLMVGLSSIAFYLNWKKKLFSTAWFLKISLFCSPLGFIALWCGWITAELGRQPWTVYKILKTADAVSSASLQDVLISLLLILLVYGVIFGYFYFLFLNKTIRKGPTALGKEETAHQPFLYMPADEAAEDSFDRTQDKA